MAATTESESEAQSVKTAPETPPARQNAADSDGGGRVKRNVRPEMMAHFEASMARHHKLLELLAKCD